MTTQLLDANVLVALTVTEHEHHDRVARWAAGRAGEVDRFALCPIVEGALVRFLVRIGESVAAATELLREMKNLARCDFWTDSLSYADANLTHVHGHRQVTDAYLASLARAHGGLLATLDEALARDLPDSVVLVPPSV